MAMVTNKTWSWTIERDERGSWLLQYWPRGDNCGFRTVVELASANFIDACTEAKYFLNIE